MRGLATDAALWGVLDPSVSKQAADVDGCGSLLYLLVTGTWPGPPLDNIEPAPRAGAHVLAVLGERGMEDDGHGVGVGPQVGELVVAVVPLVAHLDALMDRAGRYSSPGQFRLIYQMAIANGLRAFAPDNGGVTP